MDGTLMQALAYKDYNIAASKVVQPFQKYRSLDLTAAIASANALTSLPATFTADSYAFERHRGSASSRGQPSAPYAVQALVDRSIQPD